MKKRQETRINAVHTYPAGKGPDGKDTVEYFNVVETSKSYLKDKEAATAAGAKIEITRGITFTIAEAESVDDFLQMVVDPATGKPNEEEAVNIFNRGGVLKQQVEMRSTMDPEDTTDETLASKGWVENGYDLSVILPLKSERREADPYAKASRALKAAGMEIDAATLATLLKQFQAQPAGQAA